MFRKADIATLKNAREVLKRHGCETADLTAQIHAAEQANHEERVATMAKCGWCRADIPPDADYHEAAEVQCCEDCRAAADKDEDGTPYNLKRVGRETNFTDLVTLYERVNRDGDAEGFYLDEDDAQEERQPGERIAGAVYCITDDVKLV